MKSLIAAAAVLGTLAIPVAAQASTVTAASPASVQSVYKTVTMEEIYNNDGTTTVIVVTTRYYIGPLL